MEGGICHEYKEEGFDDHYGSGFRADPCDR